MTLSPGAKHSAKRSTPPSATSSAKKRKALSAASAQSVKLTNFWSSIAQTFSQHQHADASDSSEVTIIDQQTRATTSASTTDMQSTNLQTTEATGPPNVSIGSHQQLHDRLCHSTSPAQPSVNAQLNPTIAHTQTTASPSTHNDARSSSHHSSSNNSTSSTLNANAAAWTPSKASHVTLSSQLHQQKQSSESALQQSVTDVNSEHVQQHSPQSNRTDKHRHNKSKQTKLSSSKKKGSRNSSPKQPQQQRSKPAQPDIEDDTAVAVSTDFDPTIEPVAIDLKQLAQQHADKSAPSNQPKLTQTTLTPDVPPFGLQWYSYENSALFCTSQHCLPSRKVYAFDMDQTIIRPRNRGRNPKDRSDWEFCFREVVPKLRQVHQQGYKIVIFTNQKGVSLGLANPADLCGKVLDVVRKLNIPVQCVMATQHDKYRKPGRAMWDLFCHRLNGGVMPDVTKSFYVGDAAGRLRGWAGAKMANRRDHAASDRRFAYNAGLQFQTPEEVFMGWKPTKQWDWGECIPYSELPQHSSLPCPEHELRAATLEMVILVGIQGAGKTTFAFDHYVKHGYNHCNQDLLGDRHRVLQLAEKSLQSGTSVVIDRTNCARWNREEFIALAQKYNVPVKLVEIQTPIGVAQRLNAMRDVLGSEYQANKKAVPTAAFFAYERDREEPSLEEGIQTIITVPFIPKFTPEQAKLFDAVLL